MIKNTCKACNKTYQGTHEELLKIFTWNKRGNKFGETCKECAKNYHATRMHLEGKGSRVTVEELIEVLTEEGYPTTKKKMNDFIKDSYLECDLSEDKWVKWVSKDFYKEATVIEVLEGKYKICSCCRNIYPLSRYFKQKDCIGGLRTNCKRCHAKMSAESRRNNLERDRAYKRKWYYENVDAVKKRTREYAKSNPHANKKSDARHKLKKALIKLGYDNITQEQVRKLSDFKSEFSVHYAKDLVERFGDAVCLKKI